MTPIWKEILQFDITKPSDEVSIIIINNKNNKEVLAEKSFIIGQIDQAEDEPL
jgi:DNA repair protein RadC